VYLFVIVPVRCCVGTATIPACRDSSTAPRRPRGGAITGAAIVIGERVIGTGASVAISPIALAMLLQRRTRVPEPAPVAVAAIVGVIALR
jgi:hypothetical protein